MKTLNIPLEDEEYRKLLEAKGKLTWKQLLMRSIKGK